VEIEYANHPCFDDKARHTYGRVHLPVAGKCNIQCNFCNRKTSCISENRPGVSSRLLTPMQSLVYLNRVMRKIPNISVVGIAGPGDPFANPNETLGTFRLIRDLYPHPSLTLCVATNGLNILPYVDELAELKVSHVTITINAVDPKVGAKIYSWVRYNKRVYTGEEGANYLLDNQLEAIVRLKEKGILVKINTIIIPGVNDFHIEDIAKKVACLKADVLNCIPIYPVEKTPFYNIQPPAIERVTEIRKEASKHISQMNHCARCRADAVGLIGEDTFLNFDVEDDYEISFEKEKVITADRPYIAVATIEGVLINQHLGEAEDLLIYKEENNKIVFVEKRTTPPSGTGMERWKNLSYLLKDCNSLLVNGIGSNPEKVLEESGIKIFVVDGVIDEAINNLVKGINIKHLVKRKKFACGSECSGNSAGCG
jgi:nitrogen fixation protein NifB